MNAIEQTVQDNMGLVYMMLHRFNLAYNEDAVSYAMEGLFRAATSYDESSSFAFSTYATSCIYNGIQTYFRKLQKGPDTVPIKDFTNEHGETYLPSRTFKVRSAEDSAMALSTLEIYEKAWSILDTFDKDSWAYKALRLWLDSDFTLKTTEIAATLGCSQPTVSRAIMAFRNKLKEELVDARP